MHGSTLAVLQGTLDPASPLSLLRGNALVLGKILGEVDEWYERHVDRTSVAYVIGGVPRTFWSGTAVSFPEPRDLVVNMMPIDLADLAGTLPDNLRQYTRLIWKCLYPRGSARHIAYLTVNEGTVPAGRTQRRPGLHIERPGTPSAGHVLRKEDDAGAWDVLAFGLGIWDAEECIPVDGVYMASSVDDTCRVYPVLIDSPEEVSDEHGGIECMRGRLGDARRLAANELCWITDRTPHESMPRATAVYRQFFRLVVGPISTWYSAHNTPNPLGVLPDAEVSHESKFRVMDTQPPQQIG